MLQQTTTAAVIPYYERFLAEFPTLDALAAADEQQVLRLWQGLGYYRRARHLHAAARFLYQRYGNALPDDPAVWQNLPGVGPYILGAVLSQAFDRRLPIVETNSLRVLARLCGYRGDPRRGPGRRWVWQAAATLLPRRRVGAFNQALMELGSLVCTLQQPRCEQCPCQKWCLARHNGLQESIPPPAARGPQLVVQEIGVAIRDGSRLLLCRRPAHAERWPGLWETPHAAALPHEEQAAAVRRIAHSLTGLDVTPLRPAAVVRHTVTRFRITLQCWEARPCGGAFCSDFYIEHRWTDLNQQPAVPLSSPQRRLLQQLRQTWLQPALWPDTPEPTPPAGGWCGPPLSTPPAGG